MQSEKNFFTNTFARGFIIFNTSPKIAEKLKICTLSPYIASWKKTYFGPTQLWYDPRLNYATSRDNRYGVGVMGLCLNPFDDTKENHVIASRLYEALKVSEINFLEYVDQISGSFVIIYRIDTDVKILQDCAATKSVYYCYDKKYGTIAASHVNLIANSINLKPDERSEFVFRSEVYKDEPSRYLPGMITSYKGLYPLTANTALVFQSGKPERFFPRKEIESQIFNNELIKFVSSIMQNQARLLYELERPLMIATTAGRDSRVSFSALSYYDRSRFFSFYNSQTGNLSEDVNTAKRLTSEIGKSLEIFDLSSYNSSNFRNAFALTSPNGIWRAAAQCYIDEFPEHAIHIRSTVSEIGRMFYGVNTPNSVNAESLAKTYTATGFGYDPMVINSMEEFIERAEFSVENFYNYDIHDMFYWEHRNSKWQNILCMEAEMATDVFIPFNNRNLIKLFLGIPREHRKAASLHVAITNEMCPAVKKVPYIS